MNLSTILWISVGLQVFAAVYALRLIPISGRLLAWSILSIAFFLMATRRAISLLYREGYIQNEMFQALTAETVALLISALIVFGVILIKKIFVEHEKNIGEIKTLSQVVEQNPVSTIIASPKGEIQYVNPSFLNFIGLSRDDCIGKNIESIHALGKNHETYSEIFHVIESGAEWSGELLFDDQSDEPCWISARVTLIANKNHKNDQRRYSHHNTIHRHPFTPVLLVGVVSDHSDKLGVTEDKSDSDNETNTVGGQEPRGKLGKLSGF